MATDDRPSSFQPENPSSPARSGNGRSFLYIGAVLAALMVTMIVALVAPRFLEEAPLLRWLVTLGAGALTFITVLGIAWLRRSPDVSDQ